MTSSDVADSLGLAVGQYEYVEWRKELSPNNSTAEESPGASSAADLSHCVPVRVETSGTLLQDDLQEHAGRTETAMDDELHPEASYATDSSHCVSLKVKMDDMLLRDSLQEDRCGTAIDDAGNTLSEKSTDDVVDNLQSVTMTDYRLETDAGLDCSDLTSADMETDAAVTQKIDSSVSSGNTDNPVMAARSNGMQQPHGDSCNSSNANVSTICINDLSPSEQCWIKTADASEDGGAYEDTNILSLRSEMPKQSVSVSGDNFRQSVDNDHVEHWPLDGTRLGYETPAQSNNTPDGQQNSSSETITLLATTDDLDGLLEVIPKT